MKNFFQILPVMIITNILIFIIYMFLIQFMAGFVIGFSMALTGNEEAAIMELIDKINMGLVLASLVIPAGLAAAPQTRSKFYITRG